MTDRELLELAALAAGLRVVRWDDARQAFRVLEDSEHRFAFWNPMTDDGDALRLMVTLGVRCEPMDSWCVAFAGSVCAKQFSERSGNDRAAAMRRAIVRAAAEIGRSMK